uniref:Uncharacterized protein n=1 Tax=Chenopodium quinoa TaxID=63459 RepID=A0A803M1A5_CHEQI
MLGARKLKIAWGDTRIYWSWKYMPESRFPEVASLITVCWLDISGKFHAKYLSSNTTYGVYFVYKEHPAIDRCYGFERTPVEASVVEADEEEPSIDDNEHPIKNFYLKVASYTRALSEHYPTQRNDGWLEVEMSRYHVGENALNERQVLEMRIKQTKHLIWKSGIIVYGFELRPLDSLLA